MGRGLHFLDNPATAVAPELRPLQQQRRAERAREMAARAREEEVVGMVAAAVKRGVSGSRSKEAKQAKQAKQEAKKKAEDDAKVALKAAIKVELMEEVKEEVKEIVKEEVRKAMEEAKEAQIGELTSNIGVSKSKIGDLAGSKGEAKEVKIGKSTNIGVSELEMGDLAGSSVIKRRPLEILMVSLRKDFNPRLSFEEQRFS